jgi:hypothetical protein
MKSSGSVNRSRESATRYSSPRSSDFFTNASLVAREKAEIRDNKTQEYSITNFTTKEIV